MERDRCSESRTRSPCSAKRWSCRWPKRRARLLKACAWRKIVPGDIVFAPGQTIVHAHLPIGPVIAFFLVDMADGHCVELAMVGSEGAGGGILSHVLLLAFSRAIVQYAGMVAVLPLKRLEAL